MADTTYQARKGTDAGSLVLGADQLSFTPKKGDALTIQWDQVTKYQPNPPKNAKAMIKIVSKGGETVTFQLKNRTILDNLQKDITKRIKSSGGGDDSGDDDSDQSSEEGETTSYSDVGYMSTSGSVTLTDETLLYKPNEKGKSLRIGLVKVSKHQASPPKIAKAMLKLMLKTGKNHTFQLKDRDELKRFQNDVAKRIEKLQKDDESDDSESDDSEGEDSSPAIPKRIESEDSEDAEEDDDDDDEEQEEDVAKQSKGETSKEHNPAQQASESPKEGGAGGGGMLGGLIAMGDAGDGADADDSESEHMEEEDNDGGGLFMKNADVESDEEEEEEEEDNEDEDDEEEDTGAPDMDDSIDSLKGHDDDDDNLSSGSVDSFDELPEGESDAPNEDIVDMDAYAEAALDYEEDSDSDVYSDEGEMAPEGEVYSDEEDMDQGGEEVYSDEEGEGEGEVYSDEEDLEAEGEVYSDEEGEGEGEVYSDEEGDYDDDEMMEGEDEMNADDLEMDEGDDMEGSTENFDIVDEEPPDDENDAIIEEEEGDLDSDEGDEQYDDEEDEEEEEEEDEEEEQMESLLAGGDETDDEDLDDFDVLAGKGIRAEGEQSDEEGDYDEPQTRLRRHDEYIEDEPVGTGSDEESTPFFDDDAEDSFNDFGGVLDRGTLPPALKKGGKAVGGGSMGHDSVSSEETLSLSGLPGAASISSKSADYESDSEEDDDRSGSDSGSESSSGSEEDSSDYSDEEDSDSYTDSDESSGSYEDDSDYSESDSEESSEEESSEEESESDSDSYEDFDDYSDEESEEEDVEDYQDPASAWLAFSEDQNEEAFPEMQSKAIDKKKKKKKKKKRDSYAEGYEKEFSSDEEGVYSDEDYSDEEGEYSDEEGEEIDEVEYSDEGSEATGESEHSMELELDIEDLTVDDLETALVNKLSAEIGDSAGAQEAVQKMLSTIREDLLQGVEGAGKTTKPEDTGMSEDFYDWAKRKATKVIRKESSRNLMANMNDNEPAPKTIEREPVPRPLSTLPPVQDEDLFFNWKKYAKKQKKKQARKAAEPPPAGDKPEEEKAQSAQPLPEDSKEKVSEGDKSEPESSEAATTKAVAPASKGIDPSLPLSPYDDAMVEKCTERPKAEDPEARWFNWKKFRKARLPKPVGVTDATSSKGTPQAEKPSFNWKKYARKQRKKAKKKAKAGAGDGAQAGDEEKKAGEEQSADKASAGPVTTGVELLKRLIGTKEEADRSAMLKQYLAPPNPPDKTEGHIPPDELLEAIAKFVDMIRTAKQSDNAPEITLAQQIAILGRLAIVELYGDGSDTLGAFEQGLAPVFAPKFETAEE